MKNSLYIIVVIYEFNKHFWSISVSPYCLISQICVGYYNDIGLYNAS